MSTTAQLQDLHDDYVWQVNAAVGEDRPDIVRQLTSDYLDRALELFSADEPAGCGRDDCLVCQSPAFAPGNAPRGRRRRLAGGRRRLLFRRRADRVPRLR
jgi:hypothetical protein